MTDENWQTEDIVHTLGSLKPSRGVGPPRSTFKFSGPPTDPARIRVEVLAPMPRQEGRTLSWALSNFSYRNDGGENEVTVNVEGIPELVAPYGVRRNDANLTVRVRYPMR